MKHRAGHFLSRRKYILYNLSLVLIPVLLLTGLFSHLMTVHVTEEMVRRYSSELDQKCRTIDERLESFANMVAHASVDSDLTPYNLRQNSYNTVVAMQHIRRLASAQGDALVFFYVDADDCLYSSNGKWSLKTFEKEYVFEGPWNRETFETLMMTTSAYAAAGPDCVLATAKGANSYQVVVYPWRRNLIRYGAGICLIPKNWIQNVLITSTDAPVYAVDSAGHAFGQKGSAGEGFLREVLEKKSDAVKIDGKTWQVVRSQSRLIDWEYVTAVSQSEIRELMYGSHPWIFPALLTFVLLCIAVGTLLAMRYYLPVRRLGAMFDYGETDIERVHERVSDIMQLNREMERSLEETQTSLVREITAKLLWNGLDEDSCLAVLRH